MIVAARKQMCPQCAMEQKKGAIAPLRRRPKSLTIKK